MRIIITKLKTYQSEELIEEISARYNSIIKVYIKAKKEFVFMNGDTVRIYHPGSARMDGLRADVVIGTDTAYITCHSKLANPIWEIEQLYQYLDYVQDTIDKCFKEIEHNVINETMNIRFDEHLQLFAVHKETREKYEVNMICFPLGSCSGKDIAVSSKEDKDVAEWMSIHDVDIIIK